MKRLLLLIPLALASAAHAEDIKVTIERLPEVRTKALTDVAEMLDSGNTPQMVEACQIIQDRLLPHVARLEAALLDKNEADVRAGIESDLEVVARDASIRGHSQGEGGTIVKIESADACVTHLEARASWCVWQLMSPDDTFDFEAWYKRWTQNPNPIEAKP